MEKRFNLAPLGPRDAQAAPLLEAFNFAQSPQKPLLLSTRTCGPEPQWKSVVPPNAHPATVIKMSLSAMTVHTADGKFQTLLLNSGTVLGRGLFIAGAYIPGTHIEATGSFASSASEYTPGDHVLIRPAGPGLPTGVNNLDVIDGIEVGTVSNIDAAHGRLTLTPRDGSPALTVNMVGQSYVLEHGKLATLSNVVTGQTAEVTGVLNTRTHTILNTYSVIQD